MCSHGIYSGDDSDVVVALSAVADHLHPNIRLLFRYMFALRLRITTGYLVHLLSQSRNGVIRTALPMDEELASPLKFVSRMVEASSLLLDFGLFSFCVIHTMMHFVDELSTQRTCLVEKPFTIL